MIKTTALIIIDLQSGFTTKEFAKKIFEESKNYEIVVQTHFAWGNPLFEENLQWHEMPGEVWLPQYPTTEKHGYGLPRQLLPDLKWKGVQVAHLCGAYLDACILAAAFNLWDAQITPKFLEDLIEVHPEHEPIWPLIERQFGKNSRIKSSQHASPN
jgi:nicotinamidase-related amidase